MRWYHALIAGLAALLAFTVCAIFYVAADEESGGGRAVPFTARGVQVAQDTAAQAAPGAVTAEPAAIEGGGAHDEGNDCRALELCHHCGGPPGEVPCGICGGDGMAEVDCPTCGGSGFVSGEVPDDMPWVHPIRLPCPDCGGDGRVMGPCSACGGIGSLPCANCGGSGYEPCEGGG